MNGDLQELMEHIGTLHNQQMEAINNLGREFSEFKGDVNARVTSLETTESRTFWADAMKTSLGPVLVFLHILAHKLGFKI